VASILRGWLSFTNNPPKFRILLRNQSALKQGAGHAEPPIRPVPKMPRVFIDLLISEPWYWSIFINADCFWIESSNALRNWIMGDVKKGAIFCHCVEVQTSSLLRLLEVFRSIWSFCSPVVMISSMPLNPNKALIFAPRCSVTSYCWIPPYFGNAHSSPSTLCTAGVPLPTPKFHLTEKLGSVTLEGTKGRCTYHKLVKVRCFVNRETTPSSAVCIPGPQPKPKSTVL
jgi:hypothetical protein